MDDGYTTKQQNILNMMNGTRLIMGFASTMYLDSREGTYFGSMLGEEMISQAYLKAVKRYQPQRGAGQTTYARIVGYKSAYGDTLDNSYSYAPSYASSKNSFDVLTTLPILCNGKKV